MHFVIWYLMVLGLFLCNWCRRYSLIFSISSGHSNQNNDSTLHFIHQYKIIKKCPSIIYNCTIFDTCHFGLTWDQDLPNKPLNEWAAHSYFCTVQSSRWLVSAIESWALSTVEFAHWHVWQQFCLLHETILLFDLLREVFVFYSMVVKHKLKRILTSLMRINYDWVPLCFVSLLSQLKVKAFTPHACDEAQGR